MEHKKEQLSKKKIIGISIGLVFLLGTGLFLLVVGNTLTIKLYGKKEITLDVFEKYKEKGAHAKVLGMNLEKINQKGKVNSKKVGTYVMTYQAKYFFFEKSLQRKVIVVDRKAPTITLSGQEEVTLFVGDDYQEEGYQATDNYDGDITKKVHVTSTVDKETPGTYEILYEVQDSSSNKAKKIRKVTVVEKEVPKVIQTSNSSECTYIRGILLVNKTYHLSRDYAPGVNQEARSALTRLQEEASQAGYSLPLLSGYRSYQTQEVLYNNYVARDGEALANTYSAKPGQSEHQTGLAFDIGAIDNDFGETPSGKWLAENAHRFGFILRYLKGKEAITGYQYEPWHVRYVGIAAAQEIFERGITLEEYLGVV